MEYLGPGDLHDTQFTDMGLSQSIAALTRNLDLHLDLEYCPDVLAPGVETLDWWHATKNLLAAANALFDGELTTRDQWMSKRKSHIWHGQLCHTIFSVKLAILSVAVRLNQFANW